MTTTTSRLVGLGALLFASGCGAPSSTAGPGPGDAAAGPLVMAVAESPAARAEVDRIGAMRRIVSERAAGPTAMRRRTFEPALPPAVALHLQQEDAALVASFATPRSALVDYALTADGTFRVRDVTSAMSLEVSLAGARPQPVEIAGGYVVYRHALGAAADPGAATIVHRATPSGTEDFVAFDVAPPGSRVVYEVTLAERVGGMRLVGNVVEFIDASGTPRLRVASPEIVGADGVTSRARLSIEGCDADADPRAPWGRSPTPPRARFVSDAGAARCLVVVEWSGEPVAYPALLDPAWQSTGSMTSINPENKPGRENYPLVTLANGKAIAVGGEERFHDNEGIVSAELYDPATGTWAMTGPMSYRRSWHSANLLPGGKLLVAGGLDGDSGVVAALDAYGKNTSLRTSEIYDPATGKWTLGPALVQGRAAHRSVTLPSGDVMVMGGEQKFDGLYLASAEIYSAGNNTWTAVPPMAHKREGHIAEVVAGTKVLVAGGVNDVDGFLASSELFDIAAKTWSAGPDMVAGDNGRPIWMPTSTLLGDGTVLVAGGYNDTCKGCGTGGVALAGAQIYTPAQNSWTAVGRLGRERHGHTATLLSCGGQVLIAGGLSGTNYLNGAELYDPPTKKFVPTAAMVNLRAYHSAAIVTVGGAAAVLVSGGSLGADTRGWATNSAELYTGFTGPGCGCKVDIDCLGRHCVDGTCCDTACGGACDRCDLQGHIGTCTVIDKGMSGSPTCSPYVCDGKIGNCPAACVGDGDCAVNFVCSCNGQCVPKQPNGACCSNNGQCASNACVSGVCCDRACHDGCDSCTLGGRVGTCSVVPGGSVGDPSCAPYVCDGVSGSCPVACKVEGDCAPGEACACNGKCVAMQQNGACCTRGTQCVSGQCADGVCCNAACGGACDACNLNGTVGVCTLVPAGNPGAPACAPYRCDGTHATCPGSCIFDADCGGGLVCNCAGACVAPQQNGACCSRTSQCASGQCADGVCCNAACGGACDRCDLVGRAGTCTVLPAGGAGAPSCAPYLCDGASASCPPTCKLDRDCAGGFVCSCNSLCVAAQPNAACCTRDQQCASGHCADGVCCNAACGGACDACNLNGSMGTCGNVPAGNPGAPACAPSVCSGASPDCPAQCAVDANCAQGFVCNCNHQCVQPQANGACCTAANQCQSGQCVDGVCCNAACGSSCDRCNLPGKSGTCSPAPQGDPGVAGCGPYVCDGSLATCPNTCAVDRDCAGGYVCGCNNTCVPLQAKGACCTRNAQCAAGNCVDGFCCDSACGRACESCNLNGLVGTCSPVVAGNPGRASCAPYLCDGTGRDCPATCVNDNNCTGGDVCSCAGRCVAQQANGACCSRNAQCASAFCADGFCCNSPCSGACDRCDLVGREGSCTAVRRGDPGAPSCGAYVCNGANQDCPLSCAGDRDCAGGLVCDCNSKCVAPQQAGACCTRAGQCASNYCADGVCCNAPCDSGCDRCDLPNHRGSCTTVAKGDPGANPSCGPYVCDGASASCPALCTLDADCAGGQVCSCANRCVPQQPAGACCSRNQQCASGFCVDGVCCNGPCDGGCDRCKIPGKEGTCTVVAKGDPGADSACAPFVCDGESALCPGACKYDGDCAPGKICDCRGACVPPQARGKCCSQNADCVSNFCVDNVCCDGACGSACDRCDVPGSEGICAPAPKGDPGAPRCSPFACDGTHADCPQSCASDDTCDEGYACCDATCINKGDVGVACTSDCGCASGHCTDGVCCDTACGEQCAACNVPGNVGKCSPVTGPPIGKRAACGAPDAGGVACAGTCDGTHALACTYPSATTTCAPAACTGGVATTAALCDGKGGCVPGVATTCPAGCEDGTTHCGGGVLTGGGCGCTLGARASGGDGGWAALLVGLGALFMVSRRSRVRQEVRS